MKLLISAFAHAIGNQAEREIRHSQWCHFSYYKGKEYCWNELIHAGLAYRFPTIDEVIALKLRMPPADLNIELEMQEREFSRNE